MLAACVPATWVRVWRGSEPNYRPVRPLLRREEFTDASEPMQVETAGLLGIEGVIAPIGASLRDTYGAPLPRAHIPARAPASRVILDRLNGREVHKSRCCLPAEVISQILQGGCDYEGNQSIQEDTIIVEWSFSLTGLSKE